MWRRKARALFGPVGRLSPHGSPTPHTRWGAAVQVARVLEGVQGFEVFVVRPGPGTSTSLELDRIHGRIRGGWQHEVSRVEQEFRGSVLFSSLIDGEKALEISKQEWCRHCSVHCSDGPPGPH